MIELGKALPNAIEVDGSAFLIITDYRVWIDFPKIITQVKDSMDFTPIEDYFIDKIPDDLLEAFNQLSLFYSSPEITPKSSSNSDENVLSLELDGSYIFASFMQAYHIDLIDVEHLHWHKFKALLSGLPDGTIMKDIMSIRGYKKDSRDSDKIRMEAKEIWKLPKETSKEEQEILDEINELFYNS